MADRSMCKVDIDGRQVEVPRGATVMEAARKAEIGIPTLCSEELAEPYGACRLCMVDADDGSGSRLVAACTFPVRGDMKVETSSERAVSHRRMVTEMLLARWPGAEALLELARSQGVEAPRFENPREDRSPHPCILCGLCVSVCRDLVGRSAISFSGRGAHRKIRLPAAGDDTCTGCGVCAAVCPTGALAMRSDPNNPHDGETVRRAGMEITREIALSRGRQSRLRKVGTLDLTGSMNRSGRLPVMNHRMGSHEDAAAISAEAFEGKCDAGMPDDCWLGCTLSCRKGVSGFRAGTGPYKGDEVLVEGPDYRAAAGAANMGVFDPEFVMEYSFYCTTYAIDVISFSASAAFAMECFEEGILDAESTGGLELHFGDADAALALLHAIAESRGFGRIAGKGIRFMKFYFEEHYGADPAFLDDVGMECRGLEYPQCYTADSPALQAACGAAAGGYLQDGDWPIMAGLGEEAGQAPETLAEAVHSSQLWASWFGLAGLCALPWSSMDPERAPEGVESYRSLFEAVTGREVSPVDLLKMSERVHNFRRVFDLRMGHGTREQDRVPYRAQGPATESEYESRSDLYDRQLKDEAGIDPTGMSTAERLGALRKHREEFYSDLLSALYGLRGWTEDGTPTGKKLMKLGIDFPEVLDVVGSGG